MGNRCTLLLISRARATPTRGRRARGRLQSRRNERGTATSWGHRVAGPRCEDAGVASDDGAVVGAPFDHGRIAIAGGRDAFGVGRSQRDDEVANAVDLGFGDARIERAMQHSFSLRGRRFLSDKEVGAGQDRGEAALLGLRID